jgi:hypothetical protein
VTTPGYQSALENPGAAAAYFQAATAEEIPQPLIEGPPEGIVQLPGGLVIKGQVIREVEVCELTGAHEEALARAKLSNNPARFVSTLLQCGVVSVGGEEPSRDLLLQLLVGDRDALLIGIRRVTYGDEIELEDSKCPFCGEGYGLTVTLDDIPTVKLSDPALDAMFTTELRRGRRALVRLPNGADQEAVMANPDLSIAERNTVLLSRCVVTLTGADGSERQVSAFPGLVRDGLSIPDRSKILEEIKKRQPGPRLDEITFTHEICGREVPLPLEVGTLFRGV